MSNSTAPFGQEPPPWWPMIRVYESNSQSNWGCAFCDNSDTYGGVMGRVETGWNQGQDVCPNCIPTDTPDPNTLHPIRVDLDGLVRWSSDAAKRHHRHLKQTERLQRFLNDVNVYIDEHRGEDL